VNKSRPAPSSRACSDNRSIPTAHNVGRCAFRAAGRARSAATFRDHAIINPANFAILSSWRIPTPPGRRHSGTPPSPAPAAPAIFASGYADTPPRPVLGAVIQGMVAEMSSRILADLAKPAKASRATDMGT
jgi:hypothetical protein